MTAADEAAEISKAAARGELSCSEARQQAGAVLDAAHEALEAAKAAAEAAHDDLYADYEAAKAAHKASLDDIWGAAYTESLEAARKADAARYRKIAFFEHYERHARNAIDEAAFDEARDAGATPAEAREAAYQARYEATDAVAFEGVALKIDADAYEAADAAYVDALDAGASDDEALEALYEAYEAATGAAINVEALEAAFDDAYDDANPFRWGGYRDDAEWAANNAYFETENAFEAAYEGTLDETAETAYEAAEATREAAAAAAAAVETDTAAAVRHACG